MNFFAFSGLVNGLVSTICGAVVFLQNRHSRKNQIYALYCLSLSVWSYFYFVWRLADTHDAALFYARALMWGAIFIPTLHYHHILTLFDLETTRRRRLLKVFYGVAVFFFFSNFTPYFVADVGQRMSLRYWQIPGPLYHPYLALFLFQVILSLRILWIKQRTSSYVTRNEMLWIALATTIGYTSGCTNFLLQYNIPVPPYLNVAVSVYVVVAALLFFRLGLLDVRLVLKHISVVLLIYGSLLAIVLPAAVPIATHVLKHPGSNSVTIFLFFGLIVGAVLSIGPFIYAYLLRHKVWLRGNLTDGLTHELKSPLGIIQSALDRIEANVSGRRARTETLDYVRMVRKNADRLERQVGDLLQVAKLRDGEIRIRKSPFVLDAFIQEVMDHHAPSAAGKDIHLQYEPNGTKEIYADREKISLVLSNILSNAIKFTDRGTIKISISRIDNEMMCSVSDDGRGISPSDLSRVFECFYQGQKSAKGSGVGLTIARGFVEAHGGRIWAESKGPGQGTTIKFTLPLFEGKS